MSNDDEKILGIFTDAKSAIVTGIVGLVMLGLSFVISTTVSNNTDIKELTKDMSTIQSEYSDINKTLIDNHSKSNDKIDMLLAHLNQSDVSLAEVKSEVTLLEKQMDQFSRQNDYRNGSHQ